MKSASMLPDRKATGADKEFSTGHDGSGGCVQGADQRAAPRVTLLIRPAKLTTQAGEFICVIRDVSATGIKVRFFHRVPQGIEASLETETGQTIAMDRVWASDREAAYQFREEIDVSAIISEQGDFPKRKLRLSISMPIVISALGQDHCALIHNISQQGARIDCRHRLAVSQIVRIKSQRLRDIRATVRWRRDDGYGVVFEDTFGMNEFARLAASLQDRALLRP